MILFICIIPVSENPVYVYYRQAWITLGEMTKDDAMGEFVKSLDTLCPLFKPHVQAHKAEQELLAQKR